MQLDKNLHDLSSGFRSSGTMVLVVFDLITEVHNRCTCDFCVYFFEVLYNSLIGFHGRTRSSGALAAQRK